MNQLKDTSVHSSSCHTQKNKNNKHISDTKKKRIIISRKHRPFLFSVLCMPKVMLIVRELWSGEKDREQKKEYKL